MFSGSWFRLVGSDTPAPLLQVINMSYQQYELLKAEWIRNNPGATPHQYELAMLNIARKCGI
jgi:hypothetical protein